MKPKIVLHDETTRAADQRASRLNQKIRKEAQITCRPIPEDVPVKGNASAIDPATDAETEQRITAELEAGNLWAWCTVQVEVQWNGLRGVDYLGACSYHDRDDFVKNSGYYEDMLSAAVDQVAEQARAIAAEVSK